MIERASNVFSRISVSEIYKEQTCMRDALSALWQRVSDMHYELQKLVETTAHHQNHLQYALDILFQEYLFVKSGRDHFAAKAMEVREECVVAAEKTDSLMKRYHALSHALADRYSQSQSLFASLQDELEAVQSFVYNGMRRLQDEFQAQSTERDDRVHNLSENVRETTKEYHRVKQQWKFLIRQFLLVKDFVTGKSRDLDANRYVGKEADAWPEMDSVVQRLILPAFARLEELNVKVDNAVVDKVVALSSAIKNDINVHEINALATIEERLSAVEKIVEEKVEQRYKNRISDLEKTVQGYVARVNDFDAHVLQIKAHQRDELFQREMRIEELEDEKKRLVLRHEKEMEKVRVECDESLGSVAEENLVEVKKLNDAMGNLKIELFQAQQQNQELDQSLNSKIRKMESMIADLESSMAKVSSDLQTTQNNLAISETSLASVTAQLSSLQDVHQRGLEDSATRTTELQLKASSYLEEINLLRVRLFDTEAAAEQVRSAFQASSRDCDDKSAQLEALTNRSEVECASLRSELASKDAKILDLSRTSSEWISKFDVLSAETIAFQMQVAHQSSEIDRLNGELKDAAADRNRLQVRLFEVEQKLLSTEEEFRSSRQSLEHVLEQKNASLSSTQEMLCKVDEEYAVFRDASATEWRSLASFLETSLTALSDQLLMQQCVLSSRMNQEVAKWKQVIVKACALCQATQSEVLRLSKRLTAAESSADSWKTAHDNLMIKSQEDESLHGSLVSARESRIVVLEAQIQSLSTSLDGKSTDVADLTSKLMQTESDLLRTLEERDSTKARCDQLTGDLTSSQQSLQEYLMAVENWKQAYEGVVAQLNDARADLNSALSKVDLLSETIQGLEDAVSEKTEALQKLQKDYQICVVLKNEYERAVQDRDKNISLLETQVYDLQTELSNVRLSNSGLLADVASLKIDLTSALSENEQLAAQLLSLKSELSSVKSIADEFLNFPTTMAVASAALSQRLQASSHRLSSLFARVERADQCVLALRNNFAEASLRTDSEIRRLMSVCLSDSVMFCKSLTNTVLQSMNRLNSRVDSAVSQVQLFSSALSDLRSENTVLHNRIQEYSTSVYSWKAAFEELSAVHEEKIQAANELSVQTSSLRRDVANHELAFQSLTHLNRENTEELQALRQQVAEIRAELEESKEIRQRLVAENATLAETVSDLAGRERILQRDYSICLSLKNEFERTVKDRDAEVLSLNEELQHARNTLKDQMGSYSSLSDSFAAVKSILDTRDTQWKEAASDLQASRCDANSASSLLHALQSQTQAQFAALTVSVESSLSEVFRRIGHLTSQVSTCSGFISGQLCRHGNMEASLLGTIAALRTQLRVVLQSVEDYVTAFTSVLGRSSHGFLQRQAVMENRLLLLCSNLALVKRSVSHARDASAHELDRRNHENRELCSEIEETRQNVARAEATARDLADQMKAVNLEKERLLQDLSARNLQLDESVAKYEELESTTQLAMDRMTRNVSTSCTSSMQMCESVASVLQQVVDNCAGRLNRLETGHRMALQLLLRDFRRRQEKIRNLDALLAHAIESEKALKAECDQRERASATRIADLEGALSDRDGALLEKGKLLADLREHAQSVSKELICALENVSLGASTITALQKDASMKDEQLVSLRLCVQSLTQEIAELQSKHDTLASEHVVAAASLCSTSTELAECREAFAKQLKDISDEFSQVKLGADRQRMQADRAMERLTAQKLEIEHETAQMADVLTECKLRVADLEAALLKEKGNFERVELFEESTKRSFEKALEDFRKKTAEHDSLLETNASQSIRIRHLESTNAELEAALGSLREENRKILVELSMVQGQLAVLRGEDSAHIMDHSVSSFMNRRKETDLLIGRARSSSKTSNPGDQGASDHPPEALASRSRTGSGADAPPKPPPA
eukprot:ANDGO_00663.mRNA.1 hypothetical protein